MERKNGDLDGILAWRQVLISSPVLQAGLSRHPGLQEQSLPQISGPEKQLLWEAGAEFLRAKAGATPRSDTPLLDSAPREILPVLKEAEGLLQDLLALPSSRGLMEWAELAASRGFVAPSSTLISLLGLPQEQLKKVKPILGERGLWLAKLMGIEALAEPEEAETMLVSELISEWDTYGWQDRAKLLKQFRGEPIEGAFLDKCFLDRRKEVREEAAISLALTPGSKPAKRIEETASRCLKLTVEGGKERLGISYPGKEDADLVFVPSNCPLMGEKSRALAAILGMTPLNLWERTLAKSPFQLVELAQQSDHAETLCVGWQRALALFPNPVWSDALFRWAVNHHPGRVHPNTWETVSQGMYESWLTTPGTPVSHLLERAASRERLLSHQAASHLISQVRTQLPVYGGKAAAWRFPLSVMRLLQEPWPHEGESLRSDWLALLELRKRIHESIPPSELK